MCGGGDFEGADLWDSLEMGSERKGSSQQVVCCRAGVVSGVGFKGAEGEVKISN